MPKCVICGDTNPDNFYGKKCYCKTHDNIMRIKHHHQCSFEEAQEKYLKNLDNKERIKAELSLANNDKELYQAIKRVQKDSISFEEATELYNKHIEHQKDVEFRKTCTEYKCKECGKILPRQDFEENKKGIIKDICCKCAYQIKKAQYEKRKEEDFVKTVFPDITSRAKLEKRELNITVEYLKTIFPKDNCCILSGVEFDIKSYGNGKKNPKIPSLDRIDSSKGYIEGNVRWVCWFMNRALSDFGEEIFKLFAENYVNKNKN